jgi:hypothetical protein
VLDHGVVFLGKTSAAVAVEVTNTGPDALSLNCAVEGALPDAFDVTGCSGPLATLESVVIQTTCTATQAGAIEARLVITHNDADENPAGFDLVCTGYDDVIFKSGFE